MPQSLSIVEINYEDDVVTARQRAREVARLLSFDEQDQTRISTALSEIARLFVSLVQGRPHRLSTRRLYRATSIAHYDQLDARRSRQGPCGRGRERRTTRPRVGIGTHRGPALDGSVRGQIGCARGARDTTGEDSSHTSAALNGQDIGESHQAIGEA